jgi:hypothetical protein
VCFGQKLIRKIKWAIAYFLDMKTVDYNEWVPMGALVKSLGVMVFVIFVFNTFVVFLFSGFSVEAILGILFGWGIIALIFFLFWNYRGLRIQINDDSLHVVYGRFNKKSFSLKDIASCKRTQISFGRYWGIGVRFGFDGSLAYTTSFGDAVEVTPKTGRTFVFSSNRPDQVCEIVQKKSTE